LAAAVGPFLALQTLAALVVVHPIAVQPLTALELNPHKAVHLELMVLVIAAEIPLGIMAVAVAVLVQWAALEIHRAEIQVLAVLVSNGQMVLSMLAAARVLVVTTILLALEEQAVEVVGRAVTPAMLEQAAAALAVMTLAWLAATAVLVL
jgi:hypothetical protein